MSKIKQQLSLTWLDLAACFLVGKPTKLKPSMLKVQIGNCIPEKTGKGGTCRNAKRTNIICTFFIFCTSNFQQMPMCHCTCCPFSRFHPHCRNLVFSNPPSNTPPKTNERLEPPKNMAPPKGEGERSIYQPPFFGVQNGSFRGCNFLNLFFSYGKKKGTLLFSSVAPGNGS